MNNNKAKCSNFDLMDVQVLEIKTFYLNLACMQERLYCGGHRAWECVCTSMCDCERVTIYMH